MKRGPHKTIRTVSTFFLLCILLQAPGPWKHVLAAAEYEINGFYLRATPKDLSVKVEDDSLAADKYFETEVDDVLLYFVKVGETYRLYRIVREQNIRPEAIKSVLDSLKARYGTPDRQQIKTSGVRPPNRSGYVTTVKNRAIWNISETREFIAEIESRRVVCELLMAIQTFGDYTRWHPHIHLLLADGLFQENGIFYVMPKVGIKPLAELFRANVLKMLKREGKIDDSLIAKLLTWKHNSGFSVYNGVRFAKDDEKGREAPA